MTIPWFVISIVPFLGKQASEAVDDVLTHDINEDVYRLDTSSRSVLLNKIGRSSR